MRGRGQIPSSHRLLLDYLRRFGVAVEIYVMASESNSESDDMAARTATRPVVNRQLTHNTRGWIAQMVYQHAEQPGRRSLAGSKARGEQLQSLMVGVRRFDPERALCRRHCKPGQDDTVGRFRLRGLRRLPYGVSPARSPRRLALTGCSRRSIGRRPAFISRPISCGSRPCSSRWGYGSGPARVQPASRYVGGVVHLNSPVTIIDYDPGTAIRDYRHRSRGAISRGLLLQQPRDSVPSKNSLPAAAGAWTARAGFSAEFKRALHAVYAAQANKTRPNDSLRARRRSGGRPTATLARRAIPYLRRFRRLIVMAPDDAETGAVPIYGGISWTGHPITQIGTPRMPITIAKAY